MRKWRCVICDYIHEGDTPPEACPICGVGPEQFVLLAEELPPKRWKCVICDYVHEGNEPPAVCPICGVGPEQFVLLEETATALTAQTVASATPETAEAALSTISCGLFVLTACCEGRANGQCVNTVFQLTSLPSKIAVCLHKQSLTHAFVQQCGAFTVSVLPRDDDGLAMVRHFGYQTGHKVEKCACLEMVPARNGCPIVKEAVSYFEAKVIPDKVVDVGSHTLFVADVTGGRVLRQAPALTYEYYQERKAAEKKKEAGK